MLLAPEAPASAAYASLPLKRDAEFDSTSIGPAGWTLLVVLLVLAGISIWLRKGKPRQPLAAWRGLLKPEHPDGAPQVLARTALTPHASLHVVRWNGQEMLIGCTAEALTVLERREAATPHGDAR